ncbi:MAG TPA: DCC1-like thiol-disulfide oxidoreductase family protein [Methylocella sp.]|nr:DCC1-like thiol-disulfide oxidoreductase family protein [Methylocella sp.]
MFNESRTASRAWIVYDGECPFCSNYVALYRMRAQFGEVHLINARDDVPIVQEIRARGFDLDKGMVLKLGDDFYHGDKCMHMLALMSSESNTINRINKWIFSHQQRARILYPFLVAGRNFTLLLMGRRKIKPV